MAAATASLRSRIRHRNRARSWLLRAPVLVWMGYLAVRFLQDPGRSSIWNGINLAFHEIGHVLFSPLPDLLAVAGGTLTELAIPLVAAALFLRQKEDFGACLGLFWLSTALLGAAVYAGDARAQLLPLVSPFAGEPIHDWNLILGRMGLLERDQGVALALRASGLAIMLASVLAGAWVLRLMATDPERKGTPALAAGRDLGRGGLEAEGMRFQAWLAARDREDPRAAPREAAPAEGSSGGAPDPPTAPSDGPEGSSSGLPSESVRTDRALDGLRDSVDPSGLSPEERRLLDFLDRKERDG